MTAKEILVRLVDRTKQLTPNISIEFSQGTIYLKGKYVHRQVYMDADGEEDACMRMLEAIFLCGVYGFPELNKEQK